MGKKHTVGKNWVVSYSGGRLNWIFRIWRAYISLTSHKLCNSNIILCMRLLSEWLVTFSNAHGTLSWVQKGYNFSLDLYVPEGLICPTKMTTFIIFFFCSWLDICFFQLFMFTGRMRSGSYCWRSDVLNCSIRLRDCPGLSWKFADWCH